MIVLTVLIGCKGDNGNSSKLSGNAVLINDTGDALHDPVDYSGVIIELYTPVSLDSTISRLNNSYPNIGVIVGQHTDFDHRQLNPVYSTQTGPNGEFVFDFVQQGVYNVVASKEGWGYNYMYSIQVQDGDNCLTEDLILYPERELSGSYFTDAVFESNRHYVVVTSTVYHSNTNTVVNPGVVFRLYPNCSLSFYGNVEFVGGDDFALFIPDSSEQSEGEFDRIEISNEATVNSNEISNLMISGSQNGLVVKKGDLGVRDCIISGTVSSLYLLDAQNVSIRNVVIRGNQHTNSGAITLANVMNIAIEDNILANNKMAVNVVNGSQITVENVYFYNNDVCFENGYDSIDNTISWTTFDKCGECIGNGSRSNLVISNNNFDCSIGVNNHGYDAVVILNNNNFFCSDYAAISRSRYSDYSQTVYLDATSNYWGTTDLATIDEKLWDRNDEDPASQHYHLRVSEFIYLPILNSIIINAGVR
jgi:hypothetical protein